MDNEKVAVELAEHRKEKHSMDDVEEQTEIIQQLALSVKELAMNIQSMIKEQERYAKTQERIVAQTRMFNKKNVF